MADKQIYQLTETLSVSPDDWLAIDLDSSNLTRKARVGNVFSVSEGSSYTGGTADGIMFNDGNTFTTDGGLRFDATTNILTVGESGNHGQIELIRSSGGYRMGYFAAQNNGLFIGLEYNFNKSNLHLDAATKTVTIGNGTTTLGAALGVANTTDIVAHRIDLSNGQTADAFQINSYGNTGGDLLKVTSDGRLVAYEELVISDVTRSAVFWQNGTQLYLRYSTDDGVTSSSTLSQTRLDQALHALYTRTSIGAYPSTTEQFSVTINDASWTGQVINLANGQTADAFQINSYGNTGGDLFKVESDGKISSARTVSGIANEFLRFEYTSSSHYDGAITLQQYYDAAQIAFSSNTIGASIGLQNRVFSIATQNVGSIEFLTRYYEFQTTLSGGYYNFKDNNGDTILYLDNNTKSVGIGTTSIDASAKFQIDSTTQGALLPRMTTTERDAIASPATGLSIFNTTTAQPEYYSGTAWEGAAGGGVSIGDSIGGASVNQVLFADASGLLAQNSKFVFNGSTLNFTGGSSSNATNSSYGVGAGNSNFGTRNTSIGNSANGNSTGSGLTSIGKSSGQQAISDESAFIGEEAGYASNGDRNVFAGYRSGRGSTSSFCVGIGDYTLYNGNGIRNVALGTNSQNSSVGTTNDNTSVGVNSLLSNNSNYSTAVGLDAGRGNSGDYVLALGYNAGNSNTQANRFIIGQQNLPQFAGAAAAADPTTGLPAASANGVYLYWDTTDNTIKARP